MVHHVQNFPHWSDLSVCKCDLIRAHEPLISRLLSPGLELWKRFFLTNFKLFLILSPRHEDLDNWTKFQVVDLQTHFCSEHRIRGNELYSFAFAWVYCELGNNTTLTNQCTIRQFKYWNKTTVDIFVPLFLIVHIARAFLEFDSVRCKCITSSRSKWTQIMRVKTWIVFVDRWFVSSVSFDALERVECFRGFHT